MPYRPPSGKILSYSCRGGHKLQNEWCYIKIGQVLRSEMSKEWFFLIEGHGLFAPRQLRPCCQLCLHCVGSCKLNPGERSGSVHTRPWWCQTVSSKMKKHIISLQLFGSYPIEISANLSERHENQIDQLKHFCFSEISPKSFEFFFKRSFGPQGQGLCCEGEEEGVEASPIDPPLPLYWIDLLRASLFIDSVFRKKSSPQ